MGANPNGYLIIQDNAQTIESHTQLRVLIFHLAFAAWCYDFQFRDRHFDVAWYMKVTKLKGFAVPSHRDGFRPNIFSYRVSKQRCSDPLVGLQCGLSTLCVQINVRRKPGFCAEPKEKFSREHSGKGGAGRAINWHSPACFCHELLSAESSSI